MASLVRLLVTEDTEPPLPLHGITYGMRLPGNVIIQQNWTDKRRPARRSKNGQGPSFGEGTVGSVGIALAHAPHMHRSICPCSASHTAHPASRTAVAQGVSQTGHRSAMHCGCDKEGGRARRARACARPRGCVCVRCEAGAIKAFEPEVNGREAIQAPMGRPTPGTPPPQNHHHPPTHPLKAGVTLCLRCGRVDRTSSGPAERPRSAPTGPDSAPGGLENAWAKWSPPSAHPPRILRSTARPQCSRCAGGRPSPHPLRSRRARRTLTVQRRGAPLRARDATAAAVRHDAFRGRGGARGAAPGTGRGATRWTGPRYTEANLRLA